MESLAENKRACLAENRRARFDYEVLETFEAGVVLKGHEVKSVKAKRMGLAGSRAIIRGGEVYLVGAQIPPYQPLNVPPDYAPDATRKLLLKQDEIKHLVGALREGTTLIPLNAHLKGNLIKIELALARGKKKHDKREAIKKRDSRREMKRGE
ncbi:MAG: SsrA-binding protein SmpB [Candidatus Liptonbacteria bacterium]|nr:SsrA-binding protein SmpB [Candidatus Liptonbacteria bacterium]MBI3114506.1 SsrA-binding protein SmpB [Candidatus Harrisonbacteria bacterium]